MDRSRERPVAWLSLDEGDNDPTRFLTYLVALCRQLRRMLEKSVACAPISAATAIRKRF